MRRLTLALVSAAIAGSLAGCGASGGASDTGAVTSAKTPRSNTSAVTTAARRPADPVKSAPARPRLVRLAPTAYGVALVDRRGFALYRFTHDPGAASTCYGACATAWPPYVVSSKAAPGVHG